MYFHLPLQPVKISRRNTWLMVIDYTYCGPKDIKVVLPFWSHFATAASSHDSMVLMDGALNGESGSQKSL